MSALLDPGHAFSFPCQGGPAKVTQTQLGFHNPCLFCGTAYESESVRLVVLLSCLTLCDPPGLQPTRLLCPWDSPGQNTRVGCHFLLQGIFQTQGSNPDLLHCRQIVYCLSHQGSPSLKKKKKRLQLNVEIKLPLTPSLLWFMNSAHIWFRKRNVKVLLPLSHMFL